MAKVIRRKTMRRGAHVARTKQSKSSVAERSVSLNENFSGIRLTYGVPQVAHMVSLHPLTIRRAIGSGQLKAANNGGRSPYRISSADLEAWWVSRGGGVLQALPTNKPIASRDEIDELLDETAAAAHRAGYNTVEDVDQLIKKVRAEIQANKAEKSSKAGANA